MIFSILYLLGLAYLCFRGFGYLLGFGLEARRKTWSSEQYLRTKPEYREYFKE